MSRVSERLREAGFSLPPAPKAVGEYVPAVLAGDVIYTAGQLPMLDGALLAAGTVPDAVTCEIANECAAQCALNALAAASTVCDIDAFARVIKVVGYVASAAGFHEQPSVINGASEVLLIALGEAGRHAREAVGVAALPLGAPVEVSLVLQVGADVRLTS